MSFGIHVTRENTTLDANIKHYIDTYGVNSVQFFTHGPRNSRPSELDVPAIRRVCEMIAVYIHTSYLSTLTNTEHIIDQANVAKSVNARGIVVHLPKKPVEFVVEHVEVLARLSTVQIILEMTAIKAHPTDSYESPEKINRLIAGMIDRKIRNVGICIDTAHIYASGADINSYDSATKYLNALAYPDWISLIHLNGNMYDASKRAGDKHTIPLHESDFVWRGQTYITSGCRAFIEFANKWRIDYIIEIHTPNDADLRDFLNKKEYYIQHESR
jgi:endonuclease IV